MCNAYGISLDKSVGVVTKLRSAHRSSTSQIINSVLGSAIKSFQRSACHCKPMRIWMEVCSKTVLATVCSSLPVISRCSRH